MRTLKFITSISAILLLASFCVIGQPVHKTVVVTIEPLDYGEGIGIVSGTYTYHFMYKLNKEGFLESIHWNVRDFNLTNDNGEKVKVIDSGHDNYGIFWDFWNNPTGTNAAFGFPEITYDVEDGWLDNLMPSQFPTEGVFINMSAKIQVKNHKARLGTMVIVNFNGNGDPVVDILKYHK